MRRIPGTVLTALWSLVALLAVGAGTAVATGPALVYAGGTAADAIHRAGVTDALRQTPIANRSDPLWPVARRVGKVSGAGLAKMSARQMEAALRAGWVNHDVGGPVGGHVGVDEISPSHWGAAQSANLATALRALGPDAGRVFFYLAPALVERVGRTDPRQAPPADIRPIVSTLMNGGAVVYLELYRGTMAPFPAREMAIHLTRWADRWPAAGLHNLRLLIGPGVGTSQTEIWNRIRATPAGRRLLANGPGYYANAAHTSAGDAAAWAAQFAAFRAQPDASPPGGDYRVPTGGNLVLTPPGRPLLPGRSFVFTTNRPGKAVVRLVSASGKVRIIKGSLTVGADGKAVVTLPRDIKPGKYHVKVSFRGEGLSDAAIMAFTIAPKATSPLAPGSRGGKGFRDRLLEGQRVSQEAVRLLNAIQAWLDAGVTTGDLAPGAFGAKFVSSGAPHAFAPTVTLGRGTTGATPAAAAPRPITPAAGGRGSGAVEVTPVQLLINQRISQAAVVRANALEARLTGGLTGGDLAEGAITPGKLAAGVIVVAAADQARPAPSASTPKRIARGSAKGLKVTSAQLTVNLRIAEAARDRARALADRLTRGLGADDFRPGSIVAANLSPELR